MVEMRGERGMTDEAVDPDAVLATHNAVRVQEPDRYTNTPWYAGGAEDAFVCSTCRLPWRGDREAGDCEPVRLARRVIALRETLDAVAALLDAEVRYRRTIAQHIPDARLLASTAEMIRDNVLIEVHERL